MPLLVHCLTIIRDKQTGKNLGYGFVRMSTQPEAQSAKDQLHELELKGRKIRVGYVKTPPPGSLACADAAKPYTQRTNFRLTTCILF